MKCAGGLDRRRRNPAFEIQWITMLISLRLPYTAPFDWEALLSFYRHRAIAGVELATEDRYTRTVRLGEGSGILRVRHAAKAGEVVATLESTDAVDHRELAGRLSRSFDLGANLSAIAAHLAKDSFLAVLVARRPALRIPSHWDPFETALRAVLGQQVSLTAARRLQARLVERAGSALGQPSSKLPHRLFPSPQQVLEADFSAMGMPGARVRTLLAVAEAFLSNPRLFERGAAVEETIERLCAIKGIGPWTAQYIAIRACREPDGFPASDAGLLRGAAAADGTRPTPAQLGTRAEAWRPYRAYAAQHIWAEDEANVIFKK